jgi:hypothetical protein
LVLEGLAESIVEGSINTGISVLLESNRIEVGMQVDAGSCRGEHLDQIASKITSFVGSVKHEGRVKRLMDISDEMKKVPRHKGSFERNAIEIVFEDGEAPIDDIDGVDILLVRGHSAEGEVGVVDTESSGVYMLVKW